MRRPASPIMSFGTNGVVDLRVGHRRPRSGDDRQHPVEHARRGLREPDHPRQRDRRRLHVAARRHPRLRRPHRPAGVDVPHRAASRRVRLRHLAEGRLEVHRRRQQLGRDDGRRRGAASPTSRSARPPTTSTAPTASAPICSAPRSSRSTRAPASACWHFQFVHHDLWDLDPSAAPQLTTIRHNGRNRDVVVVAEQDDVALRVRPRDRRADLADRGTSGAEVRHAGRAELADAAVSDQPAAVRDGSRSASTTSVPYLPADEAETFTNAAAARRRTRASSRRSATPTRCTFRRATAACCSAAWRPSPTRGAVYVVAHDNPGILRLLRPGENAGRGGAAAVPPGQAVYQQNCQSVPRRRSPGHGQRRARSCTPPRIRRTTSPPARRASTRPRSARSSAPAKDGCRRSRT